MPIAITKEELELIEHTLCFCFKKQFYYPSEQKMAESLLEKILDYKCERDLKDGNLS
jgi:hypothetical protein